MVHEEVEGEIPVVYKKPVAPFEDKDMKKIKKKKVEGDDETESDVKCVSHEKRLKEAKATRNQMLRHHLVSPLLIKTKKLGDGGNKWRLRLIRQRFTKMLIVVRLYRIRLLSGKGEMYDETIKDIQFASPARLCRVV